jgi:hypothetical protein
VEDARYDPAGVGITDVTSLGAFVGALLRPLRGAGLEELLEVKAEVEQEHGWRVNRLHGPARQMQDAGYDEDKIITEVLAMLSAALIRYRGYFPGD